MVHYKLSYFDVRALAEPIRLIFALFDVPYEDVRVSVEQWKELKDKTPFGQMPMLEVDGVKMAQSNAICRYLGKKFGIGGKNLEEEQQIDAITDQYKDFIFFFRQFTSITFYGEDPEKIKTVADTIVRPAAQGYLAILRNILENSKSGFLVGDSLTWGDLVIADNLTSLVKNGFLDLSKEPMLKEFYDKIHEIPNIKKYVAKRKESRI